MSHLPHSSPVPSVSGGPTPTSGRAVFGDPRTTGLDHPHIKNSWYTIRDREDVDEDGNPITVQDICTYGQAYIPALKADHSFQRDLNFKAPVIADEYDPLLQLPIYVGRRIDGTLSLIDGQHSQYALAKVKSSYADVILVWSTGVEFEAELYLRLKESRLNQTVSNAIKAGVRASRDGAVRLQKLARQFKFTLRGVHDDTVVSTKGLRVIDSVKMLEDEYDYKDGDVSNIRAAFEFVSRLWPAGHKDAKDALRGDFLLGLCIVMDNPNVCHERLEKVLKLKNATPEDVRKAASSRAGNKARAVARVIEEHYNYKLPAGLEYLQVFVGTRRKKNNCPVKSRNDTRKK